MKKIYLAFVLMMASVAQAAIIAPPKAVQPVSGSVAVSNFPATQSVSGDVVVTNLPVANLEVGNTPVVMTTMLEGFNTVANNDTNVAGVFPRIFDVVPNLGSSLSGWVDISGVVGKRVLKAVVVRCALHSSFLQAGVPPRLGLLYLPNAPLDQNVNIDALIGFNNHMPLETNFMQTAGVVLPNDGVYFEAKLPNNLTPLYTTAGAANTSAPRVILYWKKEGGVAPLAPNQAASRIKISTFWRF